MWWPFSSRKRDPLSVEALDLVQKLRDLLDHKAQQHSYIPDFTAAQDHCNELINQLRHWSYVMKTASLYRQMEESAAVIEDKLLALVKHPAADTFRIEYKIAKRISVMIREIGKVYAETQQ